MTRAGTVDDASAVTGAAVGVVETHPVTLARVVRSEWIKFRTLRSTLVVLIVAVVGMLGIGLIVAYNTRHLGPDLQADDLALSATMQGYYLAQLLIGALGVLFVSGEFGTGLIRSTFASVPTRRPVLWAKAIVLTAVTAVTMITVCLVAFLAAQAVLAHYRTGYSLSDPGALRVVIGTGVYLTLIGLLGAAIGWIVRSTPGSLVAYFALVLVIPVLFGVFGSWGRTVAKFLPSDAGRSFVSSLREPDTLSPWAGLAVLVGWIAAATAVAAVSLRRRDT